MSHPPTYEILAHLTDIEAAGLRRGDLKLKVIKRCVLENGECSFNIGVIDAHSTALKREFFYKPGENDDETYH